MTTKQLLPLVVIATQFGFSLAAQTLNVPGTINSITGSNVGVGTATPGAKLDVNGNSLFRDLLRVQGSVTVPSGATGIGGELFAQGGNVYLQGFNRTTAGYAPLHFTGSGFAFLTGNVAVGAAPASYKLEVVDNSTQGVLIRGAGDTAFQMQGNGATNLFSIRNNSAGAVHLNTQNSARLAFGVSSASSGGSVAETVTITSAGYVGIGTHTPSRKLEVSGEGFFSKDSLYQLTAHNSSGSISRTSGVNLRIDNVDLWQLLTDNADGNKFFLQLTGSPQSRFLAVTTAGNVGIGTTNPTQKLSVNGAIRAKEVIVDTGWSDYVFAPDYALAPLSEVEAHIKAHQHLPGIPSASEVAENGISVGEMQAKLLAKIEELTLHQIEQQKLIQVQSRRLDSIATENLRLREQVEILSQR
jgi:hypothetical protein